jgi:hypothetical protein
VFPVHTKHKILVKAWLKSFVYVKKFKHNSSEIFSYEGGVRPLLANFALNGFEEIIQPEKLGYLSEIKRR